MDMPPVESHLEVHLRDCFWLRLASLYTSSHRNKGRNTSIAQKSRRAFPKDDDALGRQTHTCPLYVLAWGEATHKLGLRGHMCEEDCIVPYQKLLGVCLANDSLQLSPECEPPRGKSSILDRNRYLSCFSPDLTPETNLSWPPLPLTWKRSSLMDKGTANSKDTDSNLPCQINPDQRLCKRAAQKIDSFKQLYRKHWPFPSKNDTMTEKKLENGDLHHFYSPLPNSNCRQ